MTLCAARGARGWSKSCGEFVAVKIIVCGTDAAVYPHGLDAGRFPIMVERGMTPMEAVQAATSVAARYMDWSDRVGSLKAGRCRDVIAVKVDPLVDLGRLRDVALVVKGGDVIREPGH